MMAGVGAINSESVSAKDLFSMGKLGNLQGNVTVSAKGAKQFENFLKDSRPAQSSQEAVTGATEKSPVKETAFQQGQVKKEEFSPVQTDNADISADKTQLSSEEAENLAALQGEIRDLVKETLGIDDETIDAVMQEMGIVLTDLLQPDVLQQFVLLVSGGEESTDFLLDEELMGSFVDLLQLLEDFQAENQDVLMPLLEKLDTPMLLDEFLQQEGLAGEAENFDATLENVGTAIRGEVEPDVQDMEKTTGDGRQEGIAVMEDSGEVKVKVTVTQDTSEESTGNSDSTKQDASQMFFAQRQEASGERTVAAPLFAEQFNTQQVLDGQIIQPQFGSMQRMQQMIDIVNQVTQNIRNQISANTTSLEMQLHPESLGKVLFSVVSKNGVMTANFQVQTEEARHALESQMLVLRDNLEAKNLKVESVEVHVSDFSFNQSNQAEGQSQEEMARQNRRKFRFDAGEDESSEEKAVNAEQVRRQVMRDSGGSIDFTA